MEHLTMHLFPHSRGRARLAALAILVATARGEASEPLPACGAADRHFDPAAVPAAPVGAGRVFHVDAANGNDGNDGLAEARAFRTIGRAIGGTSAPVGPADTVRIKAGLYRERLRIYKSGTASAPIVIGAYGNGPVVIDASEDVRGWTAFSGQVYRARPGFRPTAVVVDDQPLFPEFSAGALAEGRWYYNAATGDLYLRVPGGGSPSTHDVGVVKDDAYEDALYLDGASYLTLYGLTVRFAGGHGITVIGDDVRVERSQILFNGNSGITANAYGSVASANLQVVRNEVYHNFLRNWPRGRYKFGGWGPGVGSTTPNALYQGNVVHKNGGEGLLSYIGPGGTVVRDNVVYDNWSVNIYVDNQPNALVENNLVYCTTPDPQDLYHNEDPEPGDNQSLKRLRAEGIMTADENYSLSPPANLRDVTIQNNVIINCRRGVQHYGAATGSGLKNVRVLHNTIVVPSGGIAGETTFAGISIPYNGGNNVGSIYRNNVVYAPGPAGGPDLVTYVLQSETDSGAPDLFQGVTLDHNLWFHAGNAYPFLWGPRYDSAYSHAEWLALGGSAHGAGDVYADPGLVSPGALDAPSKRLASVGSPAVDAGIDVGVRLDYDFCARPIGSGYDLGAFELGLLISPLQQAACPASTARFTVDAAGSCLAYQWRRNASPLSEGGHYTGVQTASLTVRPVGPNAAVGGVAIDTAQGFAYAGTEAGAVYAVRLPLP
jgi:hypothetical protein